MEWEAKAGNLVAAVVTGKNDVQPAIPFEVINPRKTTRPEKMPAKLIKMCTTVYSCTARSSDVHFDCEWNSF